jgi:hypothetical protein
MIGQGKVFHPQFFRPTGHFPFRRSRKKRIIRMDVKRYELNYIAIIYGLFKFVRPVKKNINSVLFANLLRIISRKGVERRY